MSTGTKNLAVIYIDGSSTSSVSYTLPRGGKILDVAVVDLAGVAANVTFELNGNDIIGTPLTLPGVEGAVVRTLQINPAYTNAVSGNTITVSADDSDARFLGYIYFLPPVATFNFLVGR